MQSVTGEVEMNKLWPQEKCLELMRLYRDSPILWDTKHPQYFNKLKKIDEWRKISKQLQIPYVKVRGKMHIILSSFRREKAKLTKHIMLGQQYTSGWYGFKELSFLLIKENITHKKKTKKPKVHEMNTPSSAKHIKPQMIDDHVDDDESTDDSFEIVDEISAFTLERKKVAGLMKAEKEELEEPQPSTSPETEMAADAAEMGDEISAFTNFIALKMRKYSQATNNAIQEAICDIIFKADQHFYEPVNCGATSAVNALVPSTSTASVAQVSRARSDSDDIDTVVVIKDEDSDDEYLCSVSSF